MLNRRQGLALARNLRSELERRNVPLQQLFLFGSVARDTAHEGSDIDIAVVCTPFKSTRHEEDMELRSARRSIDTRISPVSLHPEDFDDAFFGLAQEVKRHGIAV